MTIGKRRGSAAAAPGRQRLLSSPMLPPPTGRGRSKMGEQGEGCMAADCSKPWSRPRLASTDPSAISSATPCPSCNVLVTFSCFSESPNASASFFSVYYSSSISIFAICQDQHVSYIVVLLCFSLKLRVIICTMITGCNPICKAIEWYTKINFMLDRGYLGVNAQSNKYTNSSTDNYTSFLLLSLCDMAKLTDRSRLNCCTCR